MAPSRHGETVIETKPLTKKLLKGDHPTWCPGCGDFSVLAAFWNAIEKLQLPHENIVTVAGIGCSSRFPYFVNSHGAHFIHGRSLPFATAISLARPDQHVFVFGGDGDGFSIGGNHLMHTARKNINLTYVIMDNFVYGLTKNQTSPTSPLGRKSKTDPAGSVDTPINPMKMLIASGATFIARTHASQVRHVTEMVELAAQHNGFSVVECLSDCVQFSKGSFDACNPRRGGEFQVIEERKNDGTPEDADRHDPADKIAALTLAEKAWPGVFGVFYKVDADTKNQREARLVESHRKDGQPQSDIATLQQTFRRMM